ncbi:helix-turn-helix transcriptional regulator [Candidatus Daviesbacteria bacterium]|nr:helix-turn-helix transcriptional regulator [Candidatus Daviesbacteria bacterium]
MATIKNVRKEIGGRIKKIREGKEFTQEEVAEKAGMKANYYAKIERGMYGSAPEKLYAIAKALGVDISEIFPS